jgi:hypothetical protein
MAETLEERRQRQREYQRNKYPLSKAAQVTRKTGVYHERRAWIDEIKRKPCTDCGDSFPPAAMTFDHVRGTKVRKISQMLASYSKEVILAELAKCELVCANCHAIRSQKQWDEHNRGKVRKSPRGLS